VTDGTYNQAYFGVDPGQSANSGYSQYYPGAGLRSVGAAASGVWRITDNLTFVAFGSYSYLANVAGNSPIVSAPGGSRNQFVGGGALTWRFEF
jgi:outer membrane protein